MHQNSLGFRPLVKGIIDDGRRALHVETNGTIAPDPWLLHRAAHFAVSPKLPHAGDHKPSQHPDPWPGWCDVDRSILKFVVRDRGDVSDAVDMAADMNMPRERVWVMPEGTDTPTLLDRWPEIADAAAQHRINATQRLHVLAWGDVKGT